MSRAWPVPDIEPDGTLEENARRILAVKMGEFYSYAPIVHAEDEVEALHNLRIAAKRLRYTLELFRVVFGPEGERQIERVKAIQEELGQVHDHDVRTSLIEDELTILARELRAGGAPAKDSAPQAAGGGEARALGLASDAESDANPAVGLHALLERQRAGRTAHYRAFVELWDRFATEGMRADLAVLSATPLGRAA
ncbi:MAG: CHAD domain-containing protein [Chloroflexota bacterium]|nr:CHAD domain-containing protein [Chloroflexota bacterium]